MQTPMAKTSYLPSEIIEAILSKSLVKPLLRFKSVSKSWNAIISDPLFLKKYHRNYKSSNSQNLFIRNSRSSSVFTVVKLEDQKLEIVRGLERPPYDCTYFICHCEGVLLLTDYWCNRHVLWNPSTRTHTRFWIPYTGLKASYGLCYDPNTHYLTMTRRERFSGPYTDYGQIYHNEGVCVDGGIYWVWSRHNVTKIIYYDPRDDKFKILETPENIEEGKQIYLVDVGGFLCLHCRGQDETTIKIWIKEKGIDNNSWNDFITIENVENVEMSIWRFEPKYLMGNKILIQHIVCNELVVYNPLEKTFEQFGELELKCYHPGLVPYLDSPFFLAKTKPESKRKRLLYWENV